MKKKKIIVALDGVGEKNLVINLDKKYSPSELERMADEILKARGNTIDPITGQPHGLDGILFDEN